MSRLVYGIQLWGAGSTKSVIRRIQVVQNLAMCWVTNSHRLTSTTGMLTKLNWLLVNQLIYYHSFLLQYKVRKKSSPRYNLNQLSNGLNQRGRIDLTKQRWSKNIQDLYYTVDINIWNEDKISVFKQSIKS